MTFLHYSVCQETSGEWTVLAVSTDSGAIFGSVEETGLLFGDEAAAREWIRLEWEALQSEAA